MQRLRRRVKDSGHSTSPNNLAKTKTFDRNTFLECSSRMKRLVPTLGRRQDNVHAVITLEPPTRQDESEMSTFGAEEDETSGTGIDLHVIDPTKLQPVKENSNDESTCETQLVQEKSSICLILNERDHRSRFEVDTIGIHVVTLPRNPVTINTTVSTSGASATLPPAFITPKRKPTSARRVWLTKPLTSFVAFMSNIGGNIDITSYPTP